MMYATPLFRRRVAAAGVHAVVHGRPRCGPAARFPRQPAHGASESPLHLVVAAPVHERACSSPSAFIAMRDVCFLLGYTQSAVLAPALAPHDPISLQGCAAPVWLAALGAGHTAHVGGAASQLYCASTGPQLSSSGINSSFSGSLGSGGGGGETVSPGGGWCRGGVHVAAFAGIAALGVADAAASAIGLAVGRHRIFRGEPPRIRTGPSFCCRVACSAMSFPSTPVMLPRMHKAAAASDGSSRRQHCIQRCRAYTTRERELRQNFPVICVRQPQDGGGHRRRRRRDAGRLGSASGGRGRRDSGGGRGTWRCRVECPCGGHRCGVPTRGIHHAAGQRVCAAAPVCAAVPAVTGAFDHSGEQEVSYGSSAALWFDVATR